MPKRHHFIPRFLLTRFSSDPDARTVRLWRLDLATGRPGLVSVENECVRNHYYTVVEPGGTRDIRPEQALSMIEGAAAPAIEELVKGAIAPTPKDRFELALFVVFLRLRTPSGRENLRFTDEQLGRLMFEVEIENDAVLREMYFQGQSPTADDLETKRVQLREELRTGDLEMRSSPSREVAIMFKTAGEVSQKLATSTRWIMLHAPEGACFVMSDNPVVTVADEQERSVGLLSPGTETLVPLDPKFCLVLVPGPPGWSRRNSSLSQVSEVNLAIYACATECIYGPSQKSVQDVRALAKRSRRKVAGYRARPPVLWTIDATERLPDGSYRMTGASRSGKHEGFARVEGDLP